MPKNDLTIDYENNVLFLEIENNDYFSEDNISEEELDKIKKDNEVLTDKYITKKLLDKVDVCGCQMEEYTRKHMNRAKLLTSQTNPQYMATLDQDDVNKFMFSIIVSTNNARMDPEPMFIGRECKFCHKLEMWGDIDVITRMVAESTANKINNQQSSMRAQQQEENTEESSDTTSINPEDITNAVSSLDGGLGGALLGGLVSSMVGGLANNAETITDGEIKDAEIIEDIDDTDEDVENTEPAE